MIIAGGLHDSFQQQMSTTSEGSVVDVLRWLNSWRRRICDPVVLYRFGGPGNAMLSRGDQFGRAPYPAPSFGIWRDWVEFDPARVSSFSRGLYGSSWPAPVTLLALVCI